MRAFILMENTSAAPEFQCEHGLSVYVETGRHKLLADTGQSGAFLHNAEKLGIDLTKVDTLILSHGHYDHAGGIPAFAALNPQAVIYMQKNAGGAYYHRDHYIGMAPEILSLPQVRFLDGECRIDSELFLFAGIRGRRCFSGSNREMYRQEDGVMYPDSFDHEQCLVIEEGGKRLLLSGCAHNGILNILDRYREFFQEPPTAVISGLHMMKETAYDDDEVETILQTARELAADWKDTLFYTGHCTGGKAVELMKPIMGEQLRVIYAGMEVMV